MLARLRLWYRYSLIARPQGILAFLRDQPFTARILDVGCGNNAPFIFKSLFRDIHYTGLDIGDYNQTEAMLADRYVLTTAPRFAQSIEDFGAQFDAVVSSHNLEHCDDRDATLRAMCAVVKPGGSLYLAFPSEGTERLPSRRVTLNYYDDSTHQGAPPDFAKVLEILAACDFVIEFAAPSYRPMLLSLVGAIQEPLSRLLRRNMQGTWAFHGFEAIVWARKRA